MTMKETYNGWKNRQTWNVMLHINNDYDLYSAAVDFMKTYHGRTPYSDYIRFCGLQYGRTMDNIAWISTRLNYKQLNAAMQDFKGC